MKSRTLVALLLGSGIILNAGALGASDIQRLFQDMQEKLKRYQNSILDSRATNAKKELLVKQYQAAKEKFERFKAGFRATSKSVLSSAAAPVPNSQAAATPAAPATTLTTSAGIDLALQKAISGSQVKESDLDMVFEPTQDNSLDLLQGEDFWQSVTRDIQNASSSINIQMFGMEADKTGWEFAKLLAEKAKAGVKVRLVADRSGARMMGPKNVLQTTEEEKLFQFYKDNGVEVEFYDRVSKGTSLGTKLDFFHFDHRKMFLIDGKIAYTGGYTLQAASRDTKHDMMIRAQGSLVNQMQASFLTNFQYSGGKLETASKEELQAKYFPKPTNQGGSEAELKLNIPRGRHELTDSYMKEIDSAQKYLYIINPYITNDDMVKKICAAAKRGVRVELMLPGTAENALNDLNTHYHFEEMQKAGVIIHLYQGEKGLGKLHAKGMIADDRFASIGSCNMDTMSLRGNYEQNVVSRDPEFVAKVRRDLFEKDFTVSHLYQPPSSWWDRLKLKVIGGATQLLDRFD